MKKILIILFCMLLLTGVMPVSAADGLDEAAGAVSSAETLDQQIQMLYQLSVEYGGEFENGGWDLGLTCDPAEPVPEDLLPPEEETEGAELTVDDLQGTKLIALYNDDGVLRLLGDFQVRIPEELRASSLEEANAVLFMKHYLELRDDYIGTAYNRIYDVFVYNRGDTNATKIYGAWETPPLSGMGSLFADHIPLDILWNGVRQWFYGEIEVEYPEGVAVYRITGQTCSLTDLDGSFTTFEVPAEVGEYPAAYPVTGIENCYNNTLEELILPEGIVSIDTIWCEKLTKLNFPSTLERISGDSGIAGAFGFMAPIQAVELNEGLELIGDFCMTGNIVTTSFHWPSTLLNVGRGFLESGLGVPYVAVPEGVEMLPDYFLMEKGLVSCIYIPASVESFGSDLCNYGNILIYTPEDSAAARWAESKGYEWIPCASAEEMPKPEYQTEDGFTYIILEGEATVTGYTGDTECLKVPDTLGGCPVAVIREGAFDSLKTLRAIIFPDTVRKMEGSAVYMCEALEAAFLPASITEIHSQAVFFNAEETRIYAPQDSVAAEELAYQDHFEIWTPGAEDTWF